MINQKIVLVLGAGASTPFGFPSGADLKTAITTRLVFRDEWHTLLLDAGFEPDHIEKFRTALLKSGKRSVDAFLEHRTDFVDVGKAAIACALLPHEKEEYLFHRGKESWYEYFFTKLNARFEDFSHNSVSVITFNYDRSLEHYLFTALKNAYGKPPRECAEVLRSISIVHLYGQLGELPTLSRDGLGNAYGSPVTVESLLKAASGIKIIHEAITDKQPFEQARCMLADSVRVCFLGFGYDQTNLERLMGYGPDAGGPQIYGSALGFSRRELDLLKSRLQGLGMHKIVCLEGPVGEALDFLRYHCPFD